MTRRIGPIEAELLRAARGYITRHGHGSGTKLAKEIKRSNAWVSAFVAGERRIGVDDAFTLAAVLKIDTRTWMNVPTSRALDVRPVDKRELLLLRLFVQMRDEKSRKALLALSRSLVQIEQAATAERQRKRSA